MKYAAAILWLPLAAVCAEELPTQHTVVPKDTLWDLAGYYYHDPFKWPNIAQANPPPKIHDPHWIYPKQIVVIPALQPAVEQPKAAAPAAAQAPVVEPPVSAPAAPPVPKPPVVEEKPSPSPDAALPDDGFSNKFPQGLVGLPPSFVRFKAAPGWKPDGKIVENQRDGEGMLSQGDNVDVKIPPGVEVHPGDRYGVFRKSVPTDADEDQEASYLAKIGLIEIQSRVSKDVYRALILRSSDAIQATDMIQRSN